MSEFFCIYFRVRIALAASVKLNAVFACMMDAYGQSRRPPHPLASGRQSPPLPSAPGTRSLPNLMTRQSPALTAWRVDRALPQCWSASDVCGRGRSQIGKRRFEFLFRLEEDTDTCGSPLQNLMGSGGTWTDPGLRQGPKPREDRGPGSLRRSQKLGYLRLCRGQKTELKRPVFPTLESPARHTG